MARTGRPAHQYTIHRAPLEKGAATTMQGGILDAAAALQLAVSSARPILQAVGFEPFSRTVHDDGITQVVTVQRIDPTPYKGHASDKRGR